MALPSRTPQVETDRAPQTWIAWYRFARRVLELSALEASEYATARYVEDEKRRRRRRDEAP
jgi:hypothetical protein